VWLQGLGVATRVGYDYNGRVWLQRYIWLQGLGMTTWGGLDARGLNPRSFFFGNFSPIFGTISLQCMLSGLCLAIRVYFGYKCDWVLSGFGDIFTCTKGNIS
jgi:hypothetical protein